MELKRIAILGPGGNVGRAIISELLKDGTAFEITGITRETSTYTPHSQSPNVSHSKVDYNSLDSLTEAFRGHDAVINCITGGATQFEPSKLIIDAAVAAGVKFFFANEFVGNMAREQFRRMPESHAGAKVRNRDYLEELSKAGKIAWSSLNGGPFFNMWIMKGPAGFDIANRRARIYGSGEKRLYWTPLPIIALAAGNMLRNPEVVLNRPIHICPFSDLSQNIILATLETTLATKFEVEYVDIDKINNNAKVALSRGETAKAMKGLAMGGQFHETDSGNDLSELIENELVGVKEISVLEAVNDAIKQYGADCAAVEGMFKVEPCEI